MRATALKSNCLLQAAQTARERPAIGSGGAMSSSALAVGTDTTGRRRGREPRGDPPYHLVAKRVRGPLRYLQVRVGHRQLGAINPTKDTAAVLVTAAPAPPPQLPGKVSGIAE